MSLGPWPEPPAVAQSPAILLQETADGPMTLQGRTHTHTRKSTRWHKYTHHVRSRMSTDADIQLQTSTYAVLKYVYYNCMSYVQKRSSFNKLRPGFKRNS